MATTFFIGTYTDGDSKGIYRADWNDGAIRVREWYEAVNPSYLITHKNTLYAVQETENGSVSSYSIAPNGELTLTGRHPVSGDAPCHLCAVNNRLFISNYTSGALASIDLNDGGGFA
ncbi:MAG: lactonase family protein, partial [Clostridia bacterium]|nr:lactonase family protein [Clostridia bacterium]